MSERSVIQTDAAPAAIGPYSQAIRTDALVFTAGQIGSDPVSGELVGADVAAQSAQALENLAAVLEAAGSGLDRVVKTTIFLVDMGDFAVVNQAYAARVGQPFPARSTVAVHQLPKGAAVEIECVALVGAG